MHFSVKYKDLFIKFDNEEDAYELAIDLLITRDYECLDKQIMLELFPELDVLNDVDEDENYVINIIEVLITQKSISLAHVWSRLLSPDGLENQIFIQQHIN